MSKSLSPGTPSEPAPPARGDVPIAIVGMACMFPKAGGLKGFWHVLRAGIDCITDVPSTHWRPDDYYDADPKSPDRTYCRRGGFISPVAFDPTEFSMPPSALEATDTSQILGLLVARAALEDAGYGPARVFDRERTAVILGVTGCLELVIPLGARLGHPIWRRALRESGVSESVTEDVVKRISDAYVPWQENSFPGLLGNVVAGRIANRLNLQGTNCAVDAACASSHAAMHLAVLELAAGHSDMVITGGVDTFNDIFMYVCFSKTPALSPSGQIRPFSDEADGTLLGEGIGMVVLKRLDVAQRDGDRVYAIIRGVGTSSDGEGQAIYAPCSAGQRRALVRAYESSGVDPATIELVEAHGTGTKVGDVVEFEALRSVYGETEPGRPQRCAIGSVKSQIGHTKAAAGVASLIKTTLALHHKVLPPTLKVGRPNPKLAIDESPFYLNTQARPWLSRGRHPRRAALSAFGFGGSNYHAVLEEASPVRSEVAWDGSVQVFAFSADTRQGLEDRVREALDEARAVVPTDPEAWARQADASRRAFSPSHPHRLLSVVDLGAGADPRQVLDDAVQQLQGQGATRPGTPVTFLGEGAPEGRVAFLFPGQGSQYVGMGRDLGCVFPEMLDALQRADEADPEGLPLSAFIFPPPAMSPEAEARQKEELTRTDRAQPALGAVGAGCLRVLERFGLRADMMGGHSYGELVALHGAGRLDLRSFHALSRLRGRLMAEASDVCPGGMLAVTAPLEVVSRLVTDQGLDVTVANHNSPTQVVLSGTHEAIAKATAACRAEGLKAQALRVSAAFHSPLMQPASRPFGEALESVSFEASSIPVYANVTARPYAGSEVAACRHLLADQLIRPVDFVGEIESMYADGARVFIEVGPRTVLSGLVKAILGDRPHHVLAVDGSQGRASGIADLARLLARCAALGLPVSLSSWELAPPPPRKKKMEVTLVGANYRSPHSPSSVPTAPAPLPASTPAPAPSAVPATPASSMPMTTAPPSTPAASGPRVQAAPPASLPPSPAGSASPALLREAFQSVQASLAAMAEMQQQTAHIHQRFLEGQELAQRTFQQALEGQQRLVETMLGLPPTLSSATAAPRACAPVAAPYVPPVAPAPAAPSMPVPAPVPAGPPAMPVTAAPPPSVPSATAGRNGQAVTAPSPASSAAPTVSSGAVEKILLDVVSEKTGYPVEMLHLDMDLEADLGIDSIKRVEILAATEERLPEARHVETDRLGTLRTLRQVLECMGPVVAAGSSPAQSSSSAPTAPPAPADSVAASEAAEVLLQVVAEKTGYPREMLDLSMDLEADLGIDSIKRVEILASVEERLPGMRRVETDRVGSLRTLSQVVEAMGGGTVEPAPQTPTVAEPHVVHPVPSASPRPATPVASPAALTRLERRVLRAVPAPLVAAAGAPLALAPGHEVRVVDDGDLAPSLVRALEDVGTPARLVSLATCAEPHERPPAGLVIVAPSATDAPERFLKQAFAAVVSLAPALRQAGTAGGALLATVTRMDGAFGLRGGSFEPVLGGLAGLPKTVAHEWPEVSARAFDVAPGRADASAAAETIVRELATRGALEVGLDGAERLELQAVVEAIEPASATLSGIAPGDVVVITGGARGVTADVAVALARNARPTLVLLGRSPVASDDPSWLRGVEGEAEVKKAILRHGFNGKTVSPAELEREYRRHVADREIRRTLERLMDAGACVSYQSVDVRDEKALAAALERVRAVHGPIRGLVHAAGVLADRRMEDKTAEQFDGVFDTKVAGLQHLLRATISDDLRFLVLFSSVTARYGRPGQVDYCMANEVLNKVAQVEARKRPSCRVVSMNWGPWEGGMVTDALRKEFQRLGVGLIPLESGAGALLDELAREGKDVEILIGDGFPEPPSGGRPGSGTEMVPVMDLSLSLESHPFLASHCLAGRPVVPLALIIEWMGHAALHGQPGMRFFGIDDLQVVKGISLEAESTAVRFVAAPVAATSPEEVRLDVEIRSVADGSVHARGRVVLVPHIPAAPPNGKPHQLAGGAPYPHSLPRVYDDLLFHGPHFHAFESIAAIASKGLEADLRAAPRPTEWIRKPLRSEWLGDPLVLDGGLQMGLLWCFENLGEPSLPTSGTRYRQYRRFPRQGVHALLEVRRKNRRKFVGDVLFLEGDQLVAVCEGFEWVADASLKSAFARERVPEGVGKA